MSPIRESEKARYPKNWPEISKAIRARAKDRCEWCGRPNKITVVTLQDGRWTMDEGVHWWAPSATGPRAADQPDRGAVEMFGVRVKTVLTVAHLDHTPENCAPENLRALCQRCHNRYDAPTRARGRKERMQRTAALPLGDEP